MADLVTNNPLVKRLSGAIAGLFARHPSLRLAEGAPTGSGGDSTVELLKDWQRWAARVYPYALDVSLAGQLKGFALRHAALYRAAPGSDKGPSPVEIGTAKLLAADAQRWLRTLERAARQEAAAAEWAARRVGGAATSALWPFAVIIALAIAYRRS